MGLKASLLVPTGRLCYNRSHRQEVLVMTSLYYAVAAVTWISAVLGLVYALWAVRKSSGPARTSALYTLARGLALTVLAGAPFVYGSPALLMAVTGAMLLVQGGDALIGLAGKSLPRALGPLLMAALHGAGLALLGIFQQGAVLAL